MAIASNILLLLLLLSGNKIFDVPHCDDTKEDNKDRFQNITEVSQKSSFDVETVTRAALHNFQICNVYSLLDEDLEF